MSALLLLWLWKTKNKWIKLVLSKMNVSTNNIELTGPEVSAFPISSE